MLGNESDDGNVSIETIPLDDFVEENRLPRISFMKIDVEGYELHVLRGAKQVLTKHKPILMVEFVCPENRGNISDLLELADYLRSLGYTICRMEKKPWPHIREVQDSDFEAPVHFNAICYFGHHPVHV
jgi:hypothetical protein